MTTSGEVELTLVGADATVELGRRFGAALAAAGGVVVALSGQLGAGKTTFVKGLAEGLGAAAARDVTSPTFLRVVRFEGRVPLVHVDAYRMKGPADVVELGLDEDMAGGACVAVEWPEIVEAALPADRLRVELAHVDEARRRVVASATGPESARRLACVDFHDLSGAISP
jgi:tRNA threonylcarbamoyl adenosine modification protein YjeE